MSFSRSIQWYHTHADPIWPDGTFKERQNKIRYIRCGNNYPFPKGPRGRTAPLR